MCLDYRPKTINGSIAIDMRTWQNETTARSCVSDVIKDKHQHTRKVSITRTCYLGTEQCCSPLPKDRCGWQGLAGSGSGVSSVTSTTQASRNRRTMHRRWKPVALLGGRTWVAYVIFTTALESWYWQQTSYTASMLWTQWIGINKIATSITSVFGITVTSQWPPSWVLVNDVRTRKDHERGNTN
jgi:hypothetical protein